MIRDVSNTLYALEKIGLPLLCATLKAGTLKAEEASKIREMLDQAVLLTHEMEKHLGLQSKDPNFPKIKRTLAGFSSALIATRFEETGEILHEEEIPLLINGIEAFLTHAENFNFQSKNSDKNPASDLANLPLAYIPIFAPLLNPIAEFSFGQTEKKLIQNVSDVLLSRSKEVCLRLIGPLPDNKQELEANLTVLRVLAALYAKTHSAETKKIMHMDEKIRLANGSQMTIDIVWRTFDRKCAMLEALIEGLAPAEKQKTDVLSSDLSLDDLIDLEVPTAPTESPLSFFKKTQKK